MSYCANLSHTLSDLDDYDDVDSPLYTYTPSKNQAKQEKKRRQHDLPQSQSTKFTLYDFHRSSVQGEGLNHFIHTKIFQEYLKCELKPWTYPKRSTDKVELEPIPSNFLPPLNTSPIYATISDIHGNVERVRRVCGYREIFMKRMHIEYLKDKEKGVVYQILYPEKAVEEMDSAFENEEVLRMEVQSRFRVLAPGGGSKKNKENKHSSNKKKSKHKKHSKDECRPRSKSVSRAKQMKMEHGIEKEDVKHSNKHSNKRKYNSNEGIAETTRRSRPSHKSHHRRQRSQLPPQVDIYHHHRRKRSKDRRHRTQSVSLNRDTIRKDSEKRIRSQSHTHHHRKDYKGKSKKHSHNKVAREDSGAHRESKKLAKSFHKEKKRVQMIPSQEGLKQLHKSKYKIENDDKFKKSKQSNKNQILVKPYATPPEQPQTNRHKDNKLKHLEQKSDEQQVHTSSKIRDVANKRYVTIFDPKTVERDENNNIIAEVKQEKLAKHKSSTKHVSRNKVPCSGEGESNFEQCLQPRHRSPYESRLKMHAEATRGKLEDWVKNGNDHRVRLSQPDENGNYLAETPKTPQEYPSLKTSNARRPHTVITLQDEQTPSKIAQQFRDRPPVSVFAAAIAKADPTKKRQSSNPKKVAGNKPKVKKKSTAKLTTSTKGKIEGKAKTNTTEPEKILAPLFDITNYDSYYQYVFGVPIRELPERDSEWLELSVTDEDELDEEIQSFDKENPRWMIDGISFESQQLVTELKLMYWACLLTGRQFYYTIPNFLKGHMEFATKRVKMIPFFVSTFILWAYLVVMSQSFATISFTEKTTNTTNSGTAQVQIEQLEVTKYGETVMFVIANLVFVAVWSVFVILRDGQLITHYFNCWCPALAEMETSAAVKIEAMTNYNLLTWLISGGIIVTAFSIDFPANVRGTSGLVSILMFRNIFPDIRLRDEDELFWFQFFGLIFILYILFCARMLFALMQVVALIAKNSAEMWNFKFALTFNQLIMTNRGHMKRISLQLPLVKFFTHHRIMTALVKIYGDIFGVPIMTYLIVEIGLMTYIMVRLFNFKAGSDQYSKPEVRYEYFKKNATNSTTIDIKYYHSPVEEISTSLFILTMLCFDYVFTTEVIASASQAFCDGFEFVRRTNLVLCKTSHQRRLVQSLLWSMSDTDPTLLSAGNYFPICRSTIVAGLGAAVAFFSLIIQLQSEIIIFTLQFKSCAEQKKLAAIVEPRCEQKL